MKALFAVLALLLGLGAAWWTTENPTGTLDDFRSQTEATMQRLGKGVSAVREDATRLDRLQDAVDARNALVDEQLARLTERLDAQGAAPARAQAEVPEDDDAPDERLAAVADRLAELAGQIEALDDRLGIRLDAVEGQIRAVNDSASIDTQQRDMAADIANLRQELEASTAAGASDADSDELVDDGAARVVAGEIGGLNDRIRNLEDRIRSLPEASAEATDAQQQQADLQAQIMELEKRLSEAASAPDPALSDDLNLVRQEVAELASREYVTPEDLRRQQTGKTTEYKIYFARNSIEVSPEAARVLDSFILQERNRATAVSIFGFTDRTGPAEYNQQLALQRAQAVRSYLVQNGFDYTRFTSLTGLGEDAAARSLEDEQGDANQRIVVIYAHHP